MRFSRPSNRVVSRQSTEYEGGFPARRPILQAGMPSFLFFAERKDRFRSLQNKRQAVSCVHRFIRRQMNPVSKLQQLRAKMTHLTKAVPEGFHTLTPHLTVKGADQAIEFYKKAFDAEEMMRLPGPDGKSIMHAELKIGDSRVLLAEEFPQMGSGGPLTIGGSPVALHLCVEDADAVFNQAVAAGAKVNMPMGDAFWGDRYGQVTDPFGHRWSLATRKEDLTPVEIGQRAQAFFSGCAGIA
jgi:PhnB protein